MTSPGSSAAYTGVGAAAPAPPAELDLHSDLELRAALRLAPGLTILTGGQTGVDTLAARAALTRVFRADTDRTRFCAVGSVKTNIGHMDAAAGIAGFTKAVLALEHRQIPPSLHFEKPNPQIDFANSPFYVNTRLSEMKRHNGTPLRAGVSSFGVGGTNAHLIIEEAPVLDPTSGSRPWQLLVWSAKTTKALDKMTVNLADYLEPGRRGRRKARARLAERVPHDRDDVLREVLVLQIRARLRAGRPIHPLTFEFWNALTDD